MSRSIAQFASKAGQQPEYKRRAHDPFKGVEFADIVHELKKRRVRAYHSAMEEAEKHRKWIEDNGGHPGIGRRVSRIKGGRTFVSCVEEAITGRALTASEIVDWIIDHGYVAKGWSRRNLISRVHSLLATRYYESARATHNNHGSLAARWFLEPGTRDRLRRIGERRGKEMTDARNESKRLRDQAREAETKTHKPPRRRNRKSGRPSRSSVLFFPRADGSKRAIPTSPAKVAAG